MQALSPDTVLLVKDLDKDFEILNSGANRSVKDLFRFKKSQLHAPPKVVSALKNINIEVKKGERLGIIGPNGAGKSTLLKILSGISPPSKGEVLIRGRLLSILDIGTGFHPELSGRENIFLSGTLMGMNRKEVEKKYQEIVDFSGIGHAIEAPAKSYSSGMYLRLAFSVIVHLNADILLFDEVLAVGDAEFQLQCLRKIRELAETDATIVVVSHSMNDLLSLCDRIIRLEDGAIVAEGDPLNVIGEYVQDSTSTLIEEMNTEIMEKQSAKNEGENEGSGNQHLRERIFTDKEKEKHPILKVHRLSVFARAKEAHEEITMADQVVVELDLEVLEENSGAEIILGLHDQFNDQLSAMTPSLFQDRSGIIACPHKGRYQLRCIFPSFLLNHGYYHLDLGFKTGVDFLKGWLQVLSFYVAPETFQPNDKWLEPAPLRMGPVYDWEVDFEGETHRYYRDHSQSPD